MTPEMTRQYKAAWYRQRPLHAIHIGMKSRCQNPNHHAYHLYGGRGIAVCERWQQYTTFYEDIIGILGERPSKEHSLDRKDTNGNYEPSNMRWATRTEQCRNRRSNVFLIVESRSQTIAAWSEETGIPHRVLLRRHNYGWPDHEVIHLPYVPGDRSQNRARDIERSRAMFEISEEGR